MTHKIGIPEGLIIAGSVVFIAVLFVSAVFEADIRWLHFFQAWLYIATVVLAVRRNRWGYFIGISVAGLWDYTNLFVTSFLAGGVQYLVKWIQTGQLSHPDQLFSIPAWLGNLAVIVGCAWAYRRWVMDRHGDVARFTVAFVGSTAFFALAMVLFQPRYLALFPKMLHPHLPFQ